MSIVLITILFSSACSTMTGNSVKLDSGYRVGTGAVSPKTKIFLIAGSRSSANFAQEIIDQIKFWKSQGYSKEEIACYYIPPLTSDKKDIDQFGNLFSELRDCYFADPGAIFENIKSVAKSHPNEIYIYVTSHGSKPLSAYTYSSSGPEAKKRIAEVQKMPLWSDSYLMTVEGYYSVETMFWSMGDIEKGMQFALKNPKNVDRFLFSARGLRNTLNELPSETKKYVVLQGCHSGGFILPEKTVGSGNTLDGLSNTTVLTAARSDKTSFGCDTGEHTTYFGEAYMIALKKYATGKKLSEIDWQQVYKSAEAQVAKKEAFFAKSKHDYSYPQYYIN